jgi:hypothetical protein
MHHHHVPYAARTSTVNDSHHSPSYDNVACFPTTYDDSVSDDIMETESTILHDNDVHPQHTTPNASNTHLNNAAGQPLDITSFFKKYNLQQPLTIEQEVHIKLIEILDKIEAPDYAFKEILDWAAYAKSINYTFAPKLTTRASVIKNLYQHFDMEHMKPTVSEIQLDHITQPVPIVSFNFQHQLYSLLCDTSLMQPDNLVINTTKPTETSPSEAPAAAFPKNDDLQQVLGWFSHYRPHCDDQVDEVLSGDWYQTTSDQYKHPDDFVCPLIFYIDKTFVDPMKSNFNLEPLSFTLGIFNRNCRSQFRFWRTLGYVPELPLIEERRENTSLTKAQNYHKMLKHLLQGVVDMQNDLSKRQMFPLRIGKYWKYVTLHIPVAFFIADTQGADKLCGRFLSYSASVSRIHRACRCAGKDASDTSKASCYRVTMAEMMRVIESNNKELLMNYSQHYLPDHAFAKLDFGLCPHGIYGATLSDILHVIKLGIVHHLLNVLHDQDMTASSKHQVDLATKQLMCHLRQSSTSQFYRLCFPNGITSLANTTAEELVGVMFISFVLLQTSNGLKAFQVNEKFTTSHAASYCRAFEFLLIFIEWMSHPGAYWAKENGTEPYRKALNIIKLFIEYLKTNFQRESKHNWNISKIHDLLHIPWTIKMFGSPANYDSSACERMHKQTAKQPGRRCQKRHETFDKQAAHRLAQFNLIRFASDMSNNASQSGIAMQGKPDFSITAQPTNKERVCAASRFTITYKSTSQIHRKGGTLTTSVEGIGLLKVSNLTRFLYPDLVSFIALHCSQYKESATIHCCTEFMADNDICYRSHPNYQQKGYWHDWAWVKFEDSKQKGAVPSKILCFLPYGISGDNSECYVVCHPCQWQKKQKSLLVDSWTLMACNKQVNNGVPYEMVPLSSLTGHCMVVPDLGNPGKVYHIKDRSEWGILFWQTHKLFK